MSELEPIEDQHLERVKEQELQVQGAKQAAKDRLLCLAGWRIQAQRWLEGEEERQKLLQTEAACEELLTHAQQIEQKAKRAAELTAVLPLLQEIAEQQVSCDRMRRVLASLQQEYQAQTEMVEQVTARYRSLHARRRAQEDGDQLPAGESEGGAAAFG